MIFHGVARPRRNDCLEWQSSAEGRGGSNESPGSPLAAGLGRGGQDSALGALRAGLLVESGAKHGADLDIKKADSGDGGPDGDADDVAVGHMNVTRSSRRC